MQGAGYAIDEILMMAVVSDAERRVAGAICGEEHDVRGMRSEVSVSSVCEKLAVVHLHVRYAFFFMSVVMTPPPRSLVRR